MDISRRWLLRGAGVAVATGATGGASAAAGVAAQGASAMASGAGLASSLSAAERKARAAIALAKHGGFPAYEILSVVAHGKTQLPPEAWGMDSRGIGSHEIMSALFGSGHPPKAEGGYRPGKIDLSQTRHLLDAIRRLPRGVPVRDMISPEMLRDTAYEGRNSKISYWADKVKEEDVKTFFDCLGPYCDESTTVDDLEKAGVEYFTRLARHFLENPKDFAENFEDGRDVSLSFRYFLNDGCYGINEDSPHRELLVALDEREKKYKKANDLLWKRTNLRDRKRREIDVERAQREIDAREEAKRKVDAERRAMQQKEEAERKAAQQKEDAERRAVEQKEAEHRKVSASARQRFDACLFRGERGEYMVDDRTASRVLKADWLHFVQEITPDSAKPGDIELRCGGLMVAFHNAEIVQYLDDLSRGKGAGRITVSLPNRRMGVDLNGPEL